MLTLKWTKMTIESTGEHRSNMTPASMLTPDMTQLTLDSTDHSRRDNKPTKGIECLNMNTRYLEAEMLRN